MTATPGREHAGEGGWDDAGAEGGAVDAVVVTYRPDLDRLRAVLDRLLPQVRRVLVVDNGSRDQEALERLLSAHGQVTLLALGANLGVATALNLALDWARDVPEGPATWLLTLDQDSVLATGAVARVLAAFATLDEQARADCALVAMSHRPRAEHGPWASADRRLELGRVGPFHERLMVITSGNLLRLSRLDDVRFEDRLFVDQVDTAFCAAVRRRGGRILAYPEVMMDHALGTSFEHGRRQRSYHDAQRLYYIARNSTLLLGRGDLPPLVWAVQLAGQSRSYVAARGPASLARLLAALGLGLADAALKRLGRREYRVLAERHGSSARRAGDG